MNADEFGYGECLAPTERGWPCSQAAVAQDGLCRYHLKLRLRMTVPWRPEPLDRPGRKKTVKR